MTDRETETETETETEGGRVLGRKGERKTHTPTERQIWILIQRDKKTEGETIVIVSFLIECAIKFL